jgi:phosphohistidine phosphatase
MVEKMKKFTLIVARHGKASSIMDASSDFERVLKDKGVEQSHHVGRSLKAMLNDVDLVVSSSAVRAKHTAEILAKELSYSEKDIQLEPSLYESGLDEVMVVLKEIDVSNKIVLLVGHNPTWSDLVNLFQPKSVAGLRTSDIAVITFDIPGWEAVHPMGGELLYIGKFEEDTI